MSTFSEQYAEYLEPLIAALKLAEVEVEDNGTYGFADACGGNICVRLEHERGLSEFALYATVAPARKWNILLVAGLFPRTRLLPGGVQRLSLAEQAQLIQSHWDELQSLFAPSALNKTIVRLEAENVRALGAAGMRPANKTMEPTR